MIDIAHNPTVSVVIPTYNRAHLLGKAIQSVLNQTYQDFEIIVVDDGSTDNTEEVVKGFADVRIRYVRQRENMGQVVAITAGIKLARGEYIALQDDDTEWLPEKLGKQMRAFEQASPKLGVVYVGMFRTTGNERTYDPPASVTKKEGDIHEELLRKGCFMGHPCVLIERECFKTVGTYDGKLPTGFDWDMWIRISQYYDFKFIDEPLVVTSYSPATSHYSHDSYPFTMRAIILISDKHYEEFKKADRKLLAQRYFTWGGFMCISDDTSQFGEGRRYIWKAYRLCPLRPNYALFGLISLLGPVMFRYCHPILLYHRLRPLIDRLRPYLGFAYPAFNRVAQFFLRIVLGN
jgi:glycosyltransferase involved in cell wall biosynthesis